MTPIIGAHVSASGGLWTAVERGQELGAEAIQIFGSAPQTWRPTNHTAKAYERFKEDFAASGMKAAWLHCAYLPNLAHDEDEMWNKSIECVTNALTVAHNAGADGVVLHTGSHKGKGIEAVVSRVAAALDRIFENAPGDCRLALENAAGQGGAIGKSWNELGQISKAVQSPRLAVCMDTCHAFAAGYRISEEDGLRITLEELDNEGGIERLAVLHANDSLMEFCSTRDRHQNIGDGHIGSDGFRVILANAHIANLPLLLEVPGIDGKSGPDAENVRRLKLLRGDAPS